jgi:prepilin-type N-terminal cleavage/methylation domain-containing protein
MSVKTMEMITKSKSEAGFTLTELMVVVVCLGVLAALAMPNFLSFVSKAKLKDATALVAGDINLARVSAINFGTTVTVTLCYQTTPCPGAQANPTLNQVTVFFQNPAGADVMPHETLDSLIALTDASNAVVTSPQDVQFSQVGIRKFIGTNANNLCIATTGAYTACAGGNAQAFNFRTTNGNFNYRVVVAPSGKSTWCYASTCAGQ